MNKTKELWAVSVRNTGQLFFVVGNLTDEGNLSGRDANTKDADVVFEKRLFRFAKAPGTKETEPKDTIHFATLKGPGTVYEVIGSVKDGFLSGKYRVFKYGDLDPERNNPRYSWNTALTATFPENTYEIHDTGIEIRL